VAFKTQRKKVMKMLSLAAVACIAASLTLTAGPTAAQQRYQHPDPGPAIALGILGMIAGAATDASRSPPPGYYASPQAPPQYEYNSPYDGSNDPRLVCAEGFYWDGEQERCVAD
jgi:hypothetical protein